jgi:hypothetical protein
MVKWLKQTGSEGRCEGSEEAEMQRRWRYILKVTGID